MMITTKTMRKFFSCLKPFAHISLAITTAFSVCMSAQAATGAPEKTNLKFGFIKLTDMVPLAVAYENGYFDDWAGTG